MRKGLATASIAPQDMASILMKREREVRGYGSAVIIVMIPYYNVAILLVEVGAVVVCWTRCRVRLFERKQQNASAPRG